MKEIPLTQGKTAMIDDEDLELVSAYKWYAVKNNAHWYAATKVRGLPSSKRLLLMHWLILGRKRVDHIDRNGLNNQRANLRNGPSSGNRANSKLNSNNSTGFRGVCFNESRIFGAYTAWCQGYLGRFTTAEQAARAYDKAARERLGEYAQLNFPD